MLFRSKVIAIILAVVLVGGAGSYFAFIKPSPGGSTGLINRSELSCNKLLPESDFERIMQVRMSDYELKVEYDDLGTGNEDPSLNNTGGARNFGCLYIPKGLSESDQIAKNLGFEAVTADVYILLGTNDVEGSISDNFMQIKANDLKLNGSTVETAFGPYTYPADYAIEVEGIRISS